MLCRTSQLEEPLAAGHHVNISCFEEQLSEDNMCLSHCNNAKGLIDRCLDRSIPASHKVRPLLDFCWDLVHDD